MAVTLHALGLLLAVLLTGYMIWRHAARPFVPRLPYALLAVVGVIYLVWGIVPVYLYESGEPFYQWLIPGLCIGLLWLFCRPGRMRNVVAALLLAASLTLSMHYKALINSGEWTDEPTFPWGKTTGYEPHVKVQRFRYWHSRFSGLYGVTYTSLRYGVDGKPQEVTSQPDLRPR